MHADEVDIRLEDVRRALDAQHPRFRDLPLTTLAGGGTINRVFRLGDELVVRVPLIEWGAADAERESRILPRLHGALPVRTPELVALGRPAPGLPWAWTVLDWIPGRSLSAHLGSGAEADAGAGAGAGAASAAEARADERRGRVLGAALGALHTLPVGDVGIPLSTSGGDPVAERDAMIAGLRSPNGLIDVAAAVDRLERDLAHSLTPRVGVAGTTGVAGSPCRPLVWTHADPLPGNVLVGGATTEATISALIDWSGGGLGDPTHDLVAGWWTLGTAGRRAFRAALDPADADWHLARLRAWRKAAAAVGYYAGTSPIFAADARRAIDHLIADAD
ncbi:phosphotransferase [Schumannella soli]|nr:phosphotransferase [Schumannella soli]